MVWHAAVIIAYDGRDFTGSQRQPDKGTVEDECIRALKKIKAIDSVKGSRFRAASRTDRGVSALGNVIAFDTGFKRDRLLQALNAASENVYFCAYAEVGPEFTPRRAKQRWYRYFLPLGKGMDLEAMDKVAQEFVGRHDFKRFCKADGKSSEKTIDSIVLTDLGDIVVIDLKGREFLRNMVRRIVATLSSVSEGSSTIEEVREALEGRDMSFGLAPSEGLVLMKIDYGIEFVEMCPPTLERKARAKRSEKMIELLFYDSLSSRCGLD
ncbi:MAG TPA: tRNA pseudouridine(38-40) synthase TruA [Methanomassiliicoccales archaeon]|jgi:tRNA pseudouridine38-40 synthase